MTLVHIVLYSRHFDRPPWPFILWEGLMTLTINRRDPRRRRKPCPRIPPRISGSAPHPDAELLALGEEFKEAQAVAIAANTRSLEKDEEYTARCCLYRMHAGRRGRRAGLGLEGRERRRVLYRSEVDQLRDLGPERQVSTKRRRRNGRAAQGHAAK